jgi:hypothetical protein
MRHKIVQMLTLPEGQTLWLEPGNRYIVGRTRTWYLVRITMDTNSYVVAAGQFLISDRTVSRKHLLIEPERVGPGDHVRVP